MAPDEGGLVGVEVVYCPRPGVTDSTHLQLHATDTVAVALQASGVLQRHDLDAALLRVGVWNHVREPGSTLRDGDRVEIYRPLTVDPKEARRLRYKRHRDAAKAARPGTA
jgi:putative ubiquitin-RnfH superfamily antitoxin RatB of RatAB toxin-antitoxin module